ncbi:MAG: T9SS type A sorting domain-containing protein [Ignavibacteriae bacterium]|nr:T9SS type A sorting domain-containing protein [Ignavibacteriota bacterium]MCB9222063.1 T9SS type A sorting domain-containing protein [Ignavibacteria bacterium]
MNKIFKITFLILSISYAYSEKEWVMVSPPYGIYDDNMGIYCYDSLNCLAFTDIYYKKKFIQKSYNGGLTWELSQEIDYSEVPLDSVDRPYRTFIFDSLQFYTLYYDGWVIDKSTNGGKTFKRVELTDDFLDKRLDNLIMYSKYKGLTFNLGRIFHTLDNWETFTSVKIPTEYYLDKSFFYIDSNNVAFFNKELENDTSEYITNFIKYDLVNDEFSVYANLEKRGNRAQPVLNEISRVNDTVLYACGRERTGIADLAYDLIWKSTDNGKNWERLLRDPSGETFGLSHLSFKNEKHGIAVGSWSNIIETTDGGKTWRRYPETQEMASIKSEITWAGETALYTAYATGIFRLETKSEIKDISSNQRVKVYQSGHNLEIAINDDTYSSYKFQLYNSSGQQLQSNKLNSNYGFVFETVPIIDLYNGVYFYTLSKNGSIHFNGKFVVVE